MPLFREGLCLALWRTTTHNDVTIEGAFKILLSQKYVFCRFMLTKTGYTRDCVCIINMHRHWDLEYDVIMPCILSISTHLSNLYTQSARGLLGQVINDELSRKNINLVQYTYSSPFTTHISTGSSFNVPIYLRSRPESDVFTSFNCQSKFHVVFGIWW